MASSARQPAKHAESILDLAFRNRASHATDVRETFERVRRKLERGRAARAAAVNVDELKRIERR